MPRYSEGFSRAYENVSRMTLPKLEAHIADLFGFENLRYGATEAEVRAEALRQTEREFTAADRGVLR